MGYTHYWTQPRTYTRAEWAKITKDISQIVRYIRDTAGTILHVRDTGASLTISGSEEETCETFYVGYDKDGDGWSFCKTRAYPYDDAITATLAYLAAEWEFEAASDGDVNDWAAGVTYANEALKRPIPNPLFVKELSNAE